MSPLFKCNRGATLLTFVACFDGVFEMATIDLTVQGVEVALYALFHRLRRLRGCFGMRLA